MLYRDASARRTCLDFPEGSCAHNGLVAGSSPAGPTSLRSRSQQGYPQKPMGEAVCASYGWQAILLRYTTRLLRWRDQ
jgi:hypothetical protein